MSTDADLVKAARSGDRNAFTEIVERYQRAVHAVAFSRMCDRSLADDIAQDAFVTAWRRLGDLRDADRLPYWLCGIARNIARDRTKLDRRERARREQVVYGDPQTPYEQLDDAQRERLVAAALAEVPDSYREPLVLFYYEERSADDVARALGITPATVHQRLTRGRRHLAGRMAELVERGLATHGPAAGLVAAVAAAIAMLPAPDASATTPPHTRLVHGGMRIAEMATVLAAATALVIGATPDDVSAAPPRAAAAKPVAPPTSAATPTPAPARAPAGASAPTPMAQATAAPRASAPARPKLAVKPAVSVPDCDTVARHLSGLLFDQLHKDAPDNDGFSKGVAELTRTGTSTDCRREAWDDNRRLCIATADNYDRAKIDCANTVAATPGELDKLPAGLRCEVVVGHWADMILARLKRDNAGNAEVLEIAERFATAHRNVRTRDCNETPWTVERRTCIANATTDALAAACK